MASRLQARPFGPFVRGVIDRANPSVDLRGALKRAKGLLLSGAGKLSVRPGDQLQLTLKDHQTVPANVTNVLALVPYNDGALAIAYSSVTQCVYVYRLTAELTGWYSLGGTFTQNLTPLPAGILWNVVTVAPDVLVAEGLGLAYLAHTEGLTGAALSFQTMVFTSVPTSLSISGITRAGATATATTAAPHTLRSGSLVLIAGADQAEYNGLVQITVTGASTFTYAVTGTPATPATGTITYQASVTLFQADLDASGTAEDIYATWVESFKNHLWFGGFGSGTSAANAYRPELARYSLPNFGTPVGRDSITLGDRVRSQREKILRGLAVGDALFLLGSFKVSRVTGAGRNSWAREQLGGDEQFGVTGPKAACAVGEWCYGWGPRGPWRCHAGGKPEPLWASIPATVASVINPSKIVVAYNGAQDLVMFFYDASAGVRRFCAWDTERQVWVGPDDDVGLAVRYGASVTPIYASSAAPGSGTPGTPDHVPAIGPAAAATGATTSNVTTSSARASWTTGDATATSRLEYRRVGDSAWTTAIATLAPGITSYDITGLIANVPYEWRHAHDKDGLRSAYLGPSASTRFTTVQPSSGLAAPSGLTITQVIRPGVVELVASWVNSGETDVFTDVELAGQSGSPPDDSAYVVRESVAAPGSSSSPGSIRITERGTGTYWIRVRHTRSGFGASDYEGPVSATVTVTGEEE